MSAQTFKNKKMVLEHLLNAGWQISQTQFYQHCKEGLLRPGKDGKFTEAAVDKYAKRWLRLVETGEKVPDKIDRMNEERADLELKTAKIKLAREEHELGVKQSKFIPRDEFELAVVGRAVAFMAHLNHMVQELAPDWIDLVGGEQARQQELVHAISKSIEQRMSDFAADAEFDVILDGE